MCGWNLGGHNDDDDEIVIAVSFWIKIKIQFFFDSCFSAYVFLFFLFFCFSVFFDFSAFPS